MSHVESGSSPNQRKATRGVLAVAGAIVLGCFCAAPTPGDIGGCQPARDLNESAFFAAKRNVDCDHCQKCEIDSKVCTRACAGQRDPSDHLPDQCAPLAQDGAVCLRALDHASCSAYRKFVADQGATLPTECDFCALEARPFDAGGGS